MGRFPLTLEHWQNSAPLDISLKVVSGPSAGQISLAPCRGSRASNRVVKLLLANCDHDHQAMVSLTEEQRTALLAHPDGVECEDAQTRRVYVLVDAEVHRRAMTALHRSQDLAAIQAGLDDVAAGRVLTIEQSQTRVVDAITRLRQ